MHLNTSRAPVSTDRHKLNKNSKWGLSMVVYTFNPKHLGSRGRPIYKVSSRPDKAIQQGTVNKHIKWKTITPYDMVWGLYFILLSPWYEKGNQWRNYFLKKERDYSRKRKVDWGCNSRVEGFKPYECGPNFHLLEKQNPAPMEWHKPIIPAVGKKR